MWLLLCWLVGLPKLFYHFALTLPILIWYLFRKLSGGAPKNATSPPSARPSTAILLSAFQQQQLLENFRRRQRQLTGQVRAKMQLALERALRRQTSAAAAATAANRSGTASDRGRPAHRADTSCYYLAGLLLVGLICAASWPMGSYCLEQDAEILQPVAGLAKAVIKTVTLGEPLAIGFDPSGLVKNFAYFTWRTGFPVSMPRGFVQKAQDFYNRIKLRVDQAAVADVERKSLAGLKLELDQIVDAIVDEVRQSPSGLYTDYLQTRVNGVPLEDACTAVGVQLKAYGVDLTNYRNIAGMVLGIPVMPTVASTMMNVANLASLDAVRNLTQSLAPLNSTTIFLAQLPGSALHSVSSVSNSALNSIGSLSQQLPVQNLVQSAAAPLNLFRRQPAFARR